MSLVKSFIEICKAPAFIEPYLHFFVTEQEMEFVVACGGNGCQLVSLPPCCRSRRQSLPFVWNKRTCGIFWTRNIQIQYATVPVISITG